MIKKPSMLEPPCLRSSELSAGDLKKLTTLLQQGRQLSLAGVDGVSLPLPEPLVNFLQHVVQLVQQGRTVNLIPEDETLTTQAAADFLGMSRQFFVNLIEDGAIAFHMVGNHRRVHFKDLLDYQQHRDKARRQGLDKLFDKLAASGLYDAEMD